jgi:hypothetical protein
MIEPFATHRSSRLTADNPTFEPPKNPYQEAINRGTRIAQTIIDGMRKEGNGLE